MLTIPRSLARDLRTLGRKLGTTRTGPQPRVVLAAGADGLTVHFTAGAFTVCYHGPGLSAEGRVVLPLDAIPECGGKDDSPITIDADKPDAIHLSWISYGIPESRDYPVADSESPAPPPSRPSSFTSLPPSFLTALDAASQTAAKEEVRFALSHLQLRGRTGEIVATDSHQVLIQGGFCFPWTDDVLIPRSNVFAALAAIAPGPLTIGRAPAHVWLTVGCWSLALAINMHGKYPDVAAALPRVTAETTTLSLDPTDREALAAMLPALPGKDEENRPVTLDLNGQVVVRARHAAGGRSAELLLARSKTAGPPLRVVCDRVHVQRAVKLGFNTVQVAAADKPVACRDAQRSYAWMPLDVKLAVGPSDDAVQVKPPTRAVEPPKYPKRPDMPNGKESAKAHPDKPQAGTKGGLIDEAVAVRDGLRDLLGRMRGVIGEARRQRQQRRLVKTTLASLQQLEHAES